MAEILVTYSADIISFWQLFDLSPTHCANVVSVGKVI